MNGILTNVTTTISVTSGIGLIVLNLTLDLQNEILEVDQAEFIDKQNLNAALKSYLDKPTEADQNRLQRLLIKALEKTELEITRFKKLQENYLQQAVEAQQINNGTPKGYLIWARDYLINSIKDFFGSSTHQLVEKYAQLICKREAQLESIQTLVTALSIQKSTKKINEEIFTTDQAASRHLLQVRSTELWTSPCEFIVEDEFCVHNHTEKSQGGCSVAGLSDGGFIVAWEDEYFQSSICIQRYGKAGKISGNNFCFINPDPSHLIAQAPFVTASNDGGFAVAWTSGVFDANQGSWAYGVYAQCYDKEDNAQGNQITIAPYDFYKGSSLKLLNNGCLVAVGTSYLSNDGWVGADLFGSLSTSRDNQAWNVLTVDDSADITRLSIAPKLAVLSNGDFVIVWSGSPQSRFDSSIEEWNIYAQLYFQTGEPQGSVFRVNTDTPAWNLYPMVAPRSNGGFVVVWQASPDPIVEKDYNIYGQHYTSDYQPEGNRFQINLDTPYHCIMPAVSNLTDGGFVVVWQQYLDYNLSTPILDIESDIFGRIYGENHSYGPFRINNYTLGRQDSATVAGLTDGGFLVTWNSYQQNGPDSASDIYARRYRWQVENALASSYEYALMSLHVYRKPEDDLILRPLGWSVTDNNLNNGWQVILNYSNASSGYFGSAYINQAKNLLVVAHQGTEFTSLKDLWNDFQLALFNDMPQFNDVPQFYNQIEAYLSQHVSQFGDINNYTVTFTGHSLGAALAELSAAYWRRTAVTFESPGTVEVLRNKFPGMPPPPCVISYNAASNLVDTVHTHFGTIYRLYSPFDSFNYGPQHLDHVKYTFDQHSMQKLLLQFNPITEKPSIFSMMGNWPTFQKAFDLFVDYNQNRYYWEKYVSRWYFQFQRTQFIEDQLSKSHLPGNSIIGDDRGNEFWGTDSNDQMAGGTGLDHYWPFDGDNNITDRGGKDVYHLRSNSDGHTFIIDQDKDGQLLIDEEYNLAGQALRTLADTLVLKIERPIFPFSSWPTKTIPHVLLEDPQANTLTISFTDNKNQNPITIKNFVNGQFGIYLGAELSNSLVCEATGGVVNIVNPGTWVIGRGGDDTLVIDSTGGHQIFTGGGQDTIIYSKPTHSLRRLLSINSTTEPDVVEDFDYDDQLILQGYQLDEYELVSNDTATLITTQELPMIIIRHVTNTISNPFNASSPFIKIVRDNEPPIFLNNRLTIHQGQIVVITLDDLNAYDARASNLNFSISGAFHGYFRWFNETNKSITQFSILDILEGMIEFVHEGLHPPVYNVTVSNGFWSVGPMPANITFVETLSTGGMFSSTGSCSSSSSSSYSNTEMLSTGGLFSSTAMASPDVTGSHSKTNQTTLIIILSTVGSFVALVGATLCCLCYCWIKTRNVKPAEKQAALQLQTISILPPQQSSSD